MPIAAVEIEVSLQAHGKQTKDGKRLLYTFSLSYLALSYLRLIICLVIAICKKLDISVIAYS